MVESHDQVDTLLQMYYVRTGIQKLSGTSLNTC